jgi:bacterioferritin (cytochrome b1)
VELDETALRGLIEESQDTHADAIAAVREPLADMVDLGQQARANGLDPDESRAFAAENRRRLSRTGKRAGGLLAATGMIAAIANLTGSKAFAAMGTDVQVLQTASSIEVLAVATYKTALTLPYIGGSSANPVVTKFAQVTMGQHVQHADAFNAAVRSLGGKPQNKPDPAFVPVVKKAVAGLGSATPAQGALGVVALALELENIAAETYVKDTALATRQTDKQLLASIMGIEAQHVAVLLAVQALLMAGAPQLISLSPGTAAMLPAAAGSVGFPNAFYKTNSAAPAGQGAVK